MYARLCAFVFCALTLFALAVPATASTTGSGPYNVNGNKTMDFCIRSNFHGDALRAIRDYQHTPNQGNMPEPKIVKKCSRADVKISYVRHNAQGSTGLFSSYSWKLDTITIRRTCNGPNRLGVIKHEIGHAYSLKHAGNHASVMANWKHKTKYLSHYDNRDLRSLSNQHH